MSKAQYASGDIVTLKLDNAASSNTYVVESDCGDTVLLTHPLFARCLIRRDKKDLDSVSPNVKDSLERSLDFVGMNAKYLDYNTLVEHDMLCMYFVVERKFTPRQKGALANMVGTIAAMKLNNDIKAAMDLVVANAAVLDDFNAMWYRNFSALFSGKQPITSKKQRAAIFNIAGFAMAELERPAAANGYN